MRYFIDLDGHTEEYFLKFAPDTEQEMKRVIEIGIMVIERVQNSNDIDFVKKEIAQFMQKFEERINGFSVEQRNFIWENLSKNLGAEKTSVISQHLETFRVSVSTILTGFGETINKAEQFRLNNEQTIRNEISSVKDNFDPAREDSYLGKIKTAVRQLDEQVKAYFDKNRTDGFPAEMTDLLNQYFGADSSVAIALNKNFEGYVASVREEIVKLREELARQQGAAEMMDQGHLKGFKFEEECQTVLDSVARPFSDRVTYIGAEKSASKKGDFIYVLNLDGEEVKVVIECKDVSEIGLRPMMKYLDEAMENRGCSFSILVAKDPKQMQAQIGVFNQYDNRVFCTYEFLEYAIRYARLYFRNVKKRESQAVNADEVKALFSRISGALKEFSSIKQKLTSANNTISTTISGVATSLDVLKKQIEDDLKGMEGKL